MTPLVWATIALCAVAVLLIVGIPYWITFARPNHTPDHSEAGLTSPPGSRQTGV